MKFLVNSVCLGFALVLVLASPLASADPCQATLPLVEGTTATCDGILWPQAWSLVAAQCAEVDLPRCRVDQKSSELLYEASLESMKKYRQACDKTVADLQALARQGSALDRPPAAVWYFVGGLASGLIIGYIAIESLR